MNIVTIILQIPFMWMNPYPDVMGSEGTRYWGLPQYIEIDRKPEIVVRSRMIIMECLA